MTARANLLIAGSRDIKKPTFAWPKKPLPGVVVKESIEGETFVLEDQSCLDMPTPLVPILRVTSPTLNHPIAQHPLFFM